LGAYFSIYFKLLKFKEKASMSMQSSQPKQTLK
jgi:hypothetical protein